MWVGGHIVAFVLGVGGEQLEAVLKMEEKVWDAKAGLSWVHVASGGGWGLIRWTVERLEAVLKARRRWDTVRVGRAKALCAKALCAKALCAKAVCAKALCAPPPGTSPSPSLFRPHSPVSWALNPPPPPPQKKNMPTLTQHPAPRPTSQPKSRTRQRSGPTSSSPCSAGCTAGST